MGGCWISVLKDRRSSLPEVVVLTSYLENENMLS